MPPLLASVGSFDLAHSTGTDLTVRELLALGADDAALADRTLGYGAPAGDAGLRRLIGARCGVPAGRVLVTAGTAFGLFLLADALCRPGDAAVVLTPCFAPARETLAARGVAVRAVRLRFDDGYRLDVDAVAAALSPEVWLVSLASPQNPSGVAIPPAAIDALLAEMRARAPHAMLFIDESYREATFGDAEAAPSFAARDPRIITAGALSKAHGLPGLRVGWLTLPDAGVMERLLRAKAAALISGSVLDEALAAAVLAQDAPLLAARAAALGRSLRVMAEWAEEAAGLVAWIRPDAGALCCLRLRRDRFDADAVCRFWDALQAHGVRLAPGRWFGASDRVFRLGFGWLPPARLAAGLDRLRTVLERCADGAERTAPPAISTVESRRLA
jgi:aspartate/methionine/tyrosine aminotransferase